MELTGSMEAILNCPENVLKGEGSDHVIRIFQNVTGRSRGSKSRGQGGDLGLSQGHSRTSPTPPWVYKGETEAASSVQSSAQNNHAPIQHWKNSPWGRSSSGEKALLEATLAPGTLPHLYPPYPCIGYILPPSPLAASFQWSASPNPSARSPLWPSKGLCCWSLWWDPEVGLIYVCTLICPWSELFELLFYSQVNKKKVDFYSNIQQVLTVT